MRTYAICIKAVGRKDRGWVFFDWDTKSKLNLNVTWKRTLWYERKSDGVTCCAGRQTPSLGICRHLVKPLNAFAKKHYKAKCHVEIWLLDYHGNLYERMPLKFKKPKN